MVNHFLGSYNVLVIIMNHCYLINPIINDLQFLTNLLLNKQVLDN